MIDPIQQLDEETKSLEEVFETVQQDQITAEETCIICFESLLDGQVVKLACNEKHIFHEKCIKLWMEKNKN